MDERINSFSKPKFSNCSFISLWHDRGTQLVQHIWTAALWMYSWLSIWWQSADAVHCPYQLLLWSQMRSVELVCRSASCPDAVCLMRPAYLIPIDHHLISTDTRAHQVDVNSRRAAGWTLFESTQRENVQALLSCRTFLHLHKLLQCVDLCTGSRQPCQTSWKRLSL